MAILKHHVIFNISILLLLIASCSDRDDKKDKAENLSQSIQVSVKGGGAAQVSKFLDKMFNTVPIASLKLRAYKIGFSTNGNCSNPIVVDLAGEYLDFMNNPDLGSGNIPVADYKCIIIEMSDHIKFRPDQNLGSSCKTNTEYTQDICILSSNLADRLPNYQSLDGTALELCGDTWNEDRILVHLSMDTKTDDFFSANPNARFVYMYPPGGTPFEIDDIGTTVMIYGGFTLSNSFNVSSDSIGVFYMNMADKIVADDTNSRCYINDHEFGFYREPPSAKATQRKEKNSI